MILQVSVHPIAAGRSDHLGRTEDRSRRSGPHLSRHASAISATSSRAPPGRLTLSTDFLVQDQRQARSGARRTPMAASRSAVLPVEALIFLLGSRYCETDRLSNIAWSMFGHLPKGWPLVQAICDFTHNRIKFGYQHASATQDRVRRLHRAARRLPRLRPPRDRAMPLHEHSGALLHRLSRRHGHAAAAGARRFRRVVRGLSRRGAGTSSTRATTCRASAAS